MGTLIIVGGYLAALKSTLSKQLSQDTNIPCLNKDNMKEVLGDTIGFQNREQNQALSNATFQIMKFIAEKELELNRDIIIESNFKQNELLELQDMIQRTGSSVISIFLTADITVLYTRYQERQANRHLVHKSTGVISFEHFRDILEEYRKEDYYGKIIERDTTVFTKKDYQGLLKEVEQYL